MMPGPILMDNRGLIWAMMGSRVDLHRFTAFIKQYFEFDKVVQRFQNNKRPKANKP